MRERIACALAIVLAVGCGSDADDSGDDETAQAQPGASEREATPGRAGQDLWAPIQPKPAGPPLPARDPRAPLDADAVVARFERECAGGAGGGECRALRRDLELVFFADLLGLRSGGQRLDRELARTAARAQLPQLACFGLRELLLADDVSSEDARRIAEALDSPWRAPREVVRALGYRRAVPVPGLADLFERDATRQLARSADLCLDGGRDPEPNPGLAGNYPGARWRPFASRADLRWFTTPDSPEKVLAFLTRGGKPAQTGDELKAAQQAAYLEESMKLSSPEAPTDGADLTAMMMEILFRTSVDWSAPVAQLEKTGEIRYVMIAPNQAVAVFRDDALGATSIVAPRPPVFDRAALGL